MSRYDDSYEPGLPGSGRPVSSSRSIGGDSVGRDSVGREGDDGQRGLSTRYEAAGGWDDSRPYDAGDLYDGQGDHGDSGQFDDSGVFGPPDPGVYSGQDEDGGRGARGSDRRTGHGGRSGGRRSTVMLASGILAGCLALALVCGSLFAYVKYRQVWDSIKHVDVSRDLTSAKRPPVDPNAINVLLIGSDSRAGVNGKIGGHEGIGGQRSDTVMVMHISPGAHRATVLSFPRDSVVPIYSCAAEDGTSGQTAQPAGDIEQINSTFANGGPGCLWKTIEQATHIRLNAFVEMTFIGFEKIIDDLHGVNVCLPEAVDDPDSNLHLSAGRHHIYGSQALAFWRTRELLGMGSDLQRIQRDQFLMASLLQGIEKSGLLTSTRKMASVIGDVASHMTTNITSQSTMLHIAESLRGLSAKSVQFIEVPTVTYPGNINWVQWSTAAPALFAAIAHDMRLPKKSKSPAATLDTVKPSGVKVKILNGSGLPNQATEGATDLSSRGFQVVGSGNAPNFQYSDSVVEYGSSADLAAAMTVKKQLDDVEILRSSSVTPGTIDLILGSTFSALKTPSSVNSTSDLTKTYGGITGNVNVCKDTSAFAS